MEKKDQQQDMKWTDEDRLVSLPDEIMLAFERANFNMWQAQQEFQKLREEMEREY